MLLSDGLRVVHVSRHVPLRQASASAHPRLGLFFLGVLEDGQDLFMSISAGWKKPPLAFENAVCIGENTNGSRLWRAACRAACPPPAV